MKYKITEDHREFSRVDVEVLSKMQARGRKSISASTHDISMKGLFVKCKTDWPIGVECEVHLFLQGQNPPVDIKVKGRVQRVTKEGIALVFTEVSLEAYEHLHNLVLLNTSNTEKVEREFRDHLGLKKK